MYSLYLIIYMEYKFSFILISNLLLSIHYNITLLNINSLILYIIIVIENL